MPIHRYNVNLFTSKTFCRSPRSFSRRGMGRRASNRSNSHDPDQRWSRYRLVYEKLLSSRLLWTHSIIIFTSLGTISAAFANRSLYFKSTMVQSFSTYHRNSRVIIHRFVQTEQLRVKQWISRFSQSLILYIFLRWNVRFKNRRNKINEKHKCPTKWVRREIVI